MQYAHIMLNNNSYSLYGCMNTVGKLCQLVEQTHFCMH